MIVVVPEGSHFAMSFLEHDEYKGTNLAASIIAMANVVEEEDLRRIMDLLLCPTSAHVPLCTGPGLAAAKSWIAEWLAA